MARLEIEAAGNARAQVESELSRVPCALTTSEGGQLKAESELEFVRQALAVAKEACRKAKEENGNLTDERLSLVGAGGHKRGLRGFPGEKFHGEVGTGGGV